MNIPKFYMYDKIFLEKSKTIINYMLGSSFLIPILYAYLLTLKGDDKYHSLQVRGWEKQNSFVHQFYVMTMHRANGCNDNDQEMGQANIVYCYYEVHATVNFYWWTQLVVSYTAPSLSKINYTFRKLLPYIRQVQFTAPLRCLIRTFDITFIFVFQVSNCWW